jgi:beta-glucanase (GH16 family)
MPQKIACTVIAIAALAAVVLLVAILMNKPLFKPERRPPMSTPEVSTQAVAGSEFASQPSWSYDFSEPLDTKIFTPEVNGDGGGNNELQYYTDTNAMTKGGKLVIEARREPYMGKQFTSARLTTQRSFTPTYGRVVWKGVTLPAGAGMWPALWLLPANEKYSLRDMKGTKEGLHDTLNGEIDVMEWIGAKPDTIYGSAHSYINYPDHSPHTQAQTVTDATTVPHDYWLEWTPTRLTFGMDEIAYYRLDKDSKWGPANWPYDQPYYLIMNVAIGGSWGGEVSPKFTSAAMQIDGIEYYPYTGR